MSFWWFLVLAGASVLLALAVYRLRRARTAGGPPAPAPEVDVEREVRDLIDTTPELQALYQKIQCSPALERQLEQLLSELKELIRVEIPDFPAFREALRQIRARADDGVAPASQSRYLGSNLALLDAVLAAEDDRTGILEILNRNPVEDLLPFVEQIPLHRNGKIVWSTPMELAIMRKRPHDPRRFALVLEEIEKLVRSSKLSRKEQSRSEVLDTVSRARRELQRENAYILTSLKLLDVKLDEWLRHATQPASRRKRVELDLLLRELIRTRHALDEADRSALKETTQSQARQYLDGTWLHTRWLTTYVLTNLLGSELYGFSNRQRKASASPGNVLELVCEEVSSGNYDSEETTRRLRQMEERGVYVHSLSYALLRLHRPGDPASS